MRRVLDGSNSVDETYTYDAFGNKTSAIAFTGEESARCGRSFPGNSLPGLDPVQSASGLELGARGFGYSATNSQSV